MIRKSKFLPKKVVAKFFSAEIYSTLEII